MEAKLKSAYVSKERAAQIAEHEAMRLETMVGAFYLLLVRPPDKRFMVALHR